MTVALLPWTTTASGGSDTTLLTTLVVTQALTLVALVVVSVLLLQARTETRTLREQLLEQPYNRALDVAGWAVRRVAGIPARVRERGVVGGLLMAPIEDLTRWVLEDRAEIDKVTAPDGTVTILFSDIEDSTALNEQLGDEGWVRLLNAHDRVVRSAVEKHRGHVVKTQGDGFMVAFAEPVEAVRAATDIQAALVHPERLLRRTPIRVRIGLHTGEVVSREGDYFGRNVALAARVAGQAEGGQVLVSDTVRTTVHEQDPSIAFTPAVATELKGLTGTHQLWVAG